MAEERKTDELEEAGVNVEMDEHEDSSESSADDQSEKEEQNETHIKELQQTLQENPYLYDTHVQLISLLREEGELERLRAAREKMGKIFPLTEELWLSWLEDEEKLAGSDIAARRIVYQLFDRAVNDYLSVRVWLEYVQYSIGGMAETDGVQSIRSVFERAITAVGLHSRRGAEIWEAYHEFETAVLAGLQPAPGSVVMEEQQHQQDAQTERILKLMRRQLSLPLMDMKQTFAEYKEWVDPVEPHVREAYEKALRKMKQLKPYEDALASADPPRLSEYQAYIDYELKQGQPTRVQCIYERALQENCLVTDLWLHYTKYLDCTLQIESVCLGVHERAIRNCPWACPLWLGYIRALERYVQSHDTIKETFERAFGVGFGQTDDVLQLWLAYCDYLRRRINWQSEHSSELEELRSVFDKAISSLEAVGPTADPQCMLLRYWARIEAKFCGNLPRSRELWNRVLQRGHGSEAHMWLEFFNMERAYGDHKHCTKLLQNAVNSVSDWPETLFDAYTNYQREEGSLQDCVEAVGRCEAQQKRVEDRRTKAAGKESYSAHKHKKQGTFGKKGEKGHTPPDGSTGKSAGKWLSQAKVSFKRKAEESTPTSTDPGGFKMTVSPSKPKSGLKPPPGYKPSSVCPPPGYTPETPGGEGEAPPPKKTRGEDMADSTTEATSTSTNRRQACTVFVSNLDFKVDEEGLKHIFSKLGDISEVRLVKNFKGKSKGYAYIEFTDELPVTPALRLDRQPVDGRPMYVSLCQDKSASTGQSKFKYATAIEKTKVFVKGLPFTITREAVETIFQQHGKVKDIRLVTHKSGKFKGLAYIEYEDEATASRAVLKTDGLVIGEHTIEVAISNPPARKQTAASFTPSLGGGKKATDHGRARTMVSFMPRSLQKPGQGQSDAANGDPATKMSNADFRSMLLKK